MRKLLILFLAVLPGIFSGPAFGFRQVELVEVISAGQPTALATDESGRIYIGQEDGTVRVVTADGTPVMTLGGKGSLSRPGGIDVTEGGIFVTDQKQDRVAIFTRDGAPAGSFGRGGDDPKEFDRPTGILAAGGLVYVADTENDRVQIFGPNGVFLGIIGRTGAGEELLNEPTALALDAAGRLLVLDSASGEVKIYGPMGGYQGRIVPGGKGADLAVDQEGLFVADKKGYRVCKYDFSGKELFCFGSRGRDRSQFESLDTLAVDPAGRILAGDHKKRVVQVLAPAEKIAAPAERVPPPTTVRWQDEIAGLRWRQLAKAPDGRLFGIPEKDKAVVVYRGSAAEKTIRLPGWNPVALTIDAEGGLWVIDDAKTRVLKLDEAGSILLSFGSSGSREGQFDQPADLAVSKKGLVYVADRDNGRIQVFNTQGTFLNVLGGQSRLLERPAAVEVDAAEQVLVLDAKKGSVFVFSPEGRPLLSFGAKGAGAAEFQSPIDLAVTPDEIFVLDGAGAVKAFSRDGKFQRLFGAPGIGPGDFKQPSAVVALGGTELLVADPALNRLQRFQLIYTPAAPEALQGEGGMRTVSLSWSPNAESYLKSYRLYRSAGCTGDYLPLADLTETAFRDATVLPDVPYCYRLAALAREGNESARGAAVQVVPKPIVPLPPREIAAAAQEWSVDFSWAADADRTISGYRIYREVDGRPVMIGEVAGGGFYEGNLEPATEYRYAICAVSIDAVESERVPMKVTTQVATRPPLEIEVLALEDIFSNTYKIYQTDGIGRLRLTNNTRDPLSKIKVTFTVKEYMDFPWELEISNLGPRESQELTLGAVFNNRVLEVTEDTPVQAEIIASHYKNQDLRSYSRIETMRLFEKHRMTWDERERFSAFVTPKDPFILEFARSVVTQFGEFADPLVQAGVLFDALGVVGIGYLQDPSNPYQITSEKTDYVDYLQYPRETINRRSGDCDDLVGLFASLLESFGIRTMAVEVPGHMFLMFATGQEKVASDDPLREMQIEFDGTLWAPVEVTMVGQPFMKAWEAGSRAYREWQGRGLDHLDVRKAWEKFKPASLPNVDWRAPVVTREEIENRYRVDVQTLRRIRLQNRGQVFLARLKENPKDVGALVQLAIVYARAGEAAEAAAVLEKARTLRPDDATVLNNLGNIYFLSGQLEQAADAYAEAARTDPDDPNILINLARALLRQEKKAEAVEAFRKATEILPGIAAEHKTLAIALGTPY